MIQVTATYENNPEQLRETINMVVVLQLEEGQQVWLRPDSMDSVNGANSISGMYSWFSGHLVYAL